MVCNGQFPESNCYASLVSKARFCHGVKSVLYVLSELLGRGLSLGNNEKMRWGFESRRLRQNMQVKPLSPFSFPTDFNVITFDICCSDMISYFVRVANYKVTLLGWALFFKKWLHQNIYQTFSKIFSPSIFSTILMSKHQKTCF